VDVRIADGLRKRGIKTFSAIEKGMVGIPDKDHFEYAYEMRAAIFTHDHHFLEIAKELNSEGKDHWGVIFVELNKLSVGECVKRLALYADVLSAEEMKNQIEFL
jgi:predicted nuclease of predicted toxin-antitoxin system